MPKPYVRPIPVTWWLRKRAYFWFMMRELTSVFVAVYCVGLLVALWKIKTSANAGVAYDELLAFLQTPWSVAIHFLILVAAMYHTMTWFALVPKVMVVRMGEDKAPAALLVVGHWVLWLVVSLAVLWLVFRPIPPVNLSTPTPVPAQAEPATDTPSAEPGQNPAQ